ncbi:MAG: hypothetical protein KDC14_13035 [Planctomycetes bacterium]|nr:hypothetical protein [Planctomycetota bacterium]
MSRRGALTACTALGLCLLCSGEEPPERAQERVPSSPELTPGLEVRDSPQDRAARTAVDLALARLAAWQHEETDGSMPPAGAREFAPVATTALAALAWMATGSTPGRGPYGAELSRALDYLIDHTELDEKSETYGYVSDQRDALSRTHGHGFATLAMAQAFALSPESARGRRLQTALHAAVACIENSQGSEGGWEYAPKKLVNHEGSVTICLVQALRGAKDAGLAVDRKVIERALGYVRRSQKDDGSFRYAIGNDRSSVALTAAALATLNAGGEYSGSVVLSGFDWLVRELANRAEDRAWASGERPTSHFPHYERFYLAQALWQHSERRVFDEWFAEEQRRLLLDQQEEGAWLDDSYGAVYATSMSVLVLALPDGLLPVYLR